MLNAFRKILRPTLRQQLEAGVREALRRYADRRTAPDLRVYVSTDLVPEGMQSAMWARDEADHLRRFAAQWAEDNGIRRAGLRVETILLDTKREFAFVKPVGLDAPPEGAPAQPMAAASAAPVAPAAPMAPAGTAVHAGGGGGALLEVVSSDVPRDPLRISGETVVGRKSDAGVLGLGDRYMSSKHARLVWDGRQLRVTDLDSKNRTFVNEVPISPHQEITISPGDTIRMGNTVFRYTDAG
jgi:hypothetical protein